MKMQVVSIMERSTGSVVAAIKRLLGITDGQAAALMPYGDASPTHFVGGYIPQDGMSETDRMLEEDNEGWDVIS